MLFNRPRDWLDMQVMVKNLGENWDTDEIERWLIDSVREDDVRLERFRRLLAEPDVFPLQGG